MNKRFKEAFQRYKNVSTWKDPQDHLVLRGKQIKITMRDHFTIRKMAIIKKSQKEKY